jgi:hypothetical protein
MVDVYSYNRNHKYPAGTLLKYKGACSTDDRYGEAVGSDDKAAFIEHKYWWTFILPLQPKL